MVKYSTQTKNAIAYGTIKINIENLHSQSHQSKKVNQLILTLEKVRVSTDGLETKRKKNRKGKN